MIEQEIQLSSIPSTTYIFIRLIADCASQEELNKLIKMYPDDYRRLQILGDIHRLIEEFNSTPISTLL